MAVSGEELSEYAQKFKGTPYVWGGNSLTAGVDCSGLVQQVFKKFGITLPRTTYDMIGEGSPVGMKGLRPGDLMFFEFNPNIAGPDHVGIYMGDGKMVHAPRPGKSVEVVDVTKGYYLDTFSGGRRIDGTSAVGAKSTDFQESPKLTPEELAASYGWAYGFLNSNSELKGIFKEAVSGTWTPEKFQAELRDTAWWKKTSDTRRQAQVMKSTDPATWSASIAAAEIQVRQLAGEIGAAVPASKLKTIATAMIETGMDEDQLRNALGQYVTFTKEGTLRGEAAMHEYTIKQYAYDQGVGLTDQAVKNQAQKIVRKVATTQDFESQIRENAKSMFPAFEKQIDAGSTVRDIAGPYMQMMSGELQLPESSIDVMNPQIKRALNGLDANGKPGGLSLTDFQAQLKNDPRWTRTDSALDQTMQAGLTVLQDMGLKSGRQG